jgi:hypothetical protein
MRRLFVDTWRTGLLRANFSWLPESRRRKTKLTFESAVKRRLRLIANFTSDLRNSAARGLQHLRAELKPPAGQVSEYLKVIGVRS